MLNIYFSGIGGVGIGPLAQIARDAGYQVQGSNMGETLITNELRTQGVTIYLDQSGSSLQAVQDAQSIDWFVYTSALPDDHPELLLAKKLGIKTAKRDELLAVIIKEKKLHLIAVAGTSGKTTTTSMLVWAFMQQNIPVSYSIGSTISFGPSGKFDPESKFFIYECDEFDRNFLHFSPDLSIITAISYDHPDVYATVSEYMAAFRQFIDQSSATILWQEDNEKIQAKKGDAVKILESNEVLPLAIAGTHNKRNATLVARAVTQLQLMDESSAVTVLEKFPGADRRFERLAENLYSDYAVLPVAIAATLQRAREMTDNVVVVYQPHQNVRQHDIRSKYTDCFDLADKVYWLPTYLTREDPSLPVLTSQELTENITNKHIVFADLNDTLWETIESARNKDVLVLLMGAGSIDKWAREKLDQ